MKAAILKAPFEISVKELPIPTPGPDELLIRVEASAICGSDLKAYRGKHPLIKPPIILGHEFSGVIAAKGSAVKGFQIRERVVVEPSFACGHCFFCERQAYYLCQDLKQLGHQLPGSFADYAVAKAQFAYSLPDTVSFETAALTQPLAISIHAIDRARVEKGNSVAILGMGAIGLLLLQIVRRRGGRVFASDVVEFKLAKAKTLGAEKVGNGSSGEIVNQILAWTGGLGADVVIEAVGSSATVGQAFSAVRRGGTILLLGVTGHAKEEVYLERVTQDELNVLGTIRYAQGDFAKAIEMIHKKEVDLDALIAKRFLLEQTPGIFLEILKSPEKPLRAVMIAKGA